MHIENNIIKYAKVSKDKETTRVDAYGISFYEDLAQGIKQVIEETYSHRTPISINLSEEMYNYFDMPTIIGNKDLPRAIKSEFDSYCDEKDYNPNVFETRYALVEKPDDKDNLKVIHISANKLELNKQTQNFDGFRLTTVSPISMAITNLTDIKGKGNALIVNMEDKTIITTILNKSVFETDVLDEGSGEVLSKINRKENSYSKAYEECKNTTIYTAGGAGLESEQTYLEDVMPTLYEIVGKVKKKINSSPEKIENVYLTGTLSCINNVDLYFQEYIPEAKCEILKPYFIQTVGTEINIKDYIEVNSAISLALQGLGEGINGMNFKKQSFYEKLPEWMKADTGTGGKAGASGWVTFDFNTKLTSIEKKLIRVAATLVIITVVYSGFTIYLDNKMTVKQAEVQAKIQNVQEQIKLAQEDRTRVDNKTNEYKTMIQNIEDKNDRLSEINRSRNLIPNLLNQIMQVVPSEVQVLSIENTTDRHIVITAQASKYEQLGYFKARLKTENILTNVISDSGVKNGDAVKVTIEGDMQ